jgi:hypothetical protein
VNRPTAILIAGANGSGKTTFARQVLPMLHAGVAFINADEIQRQGGEFEGAVAAAREFLRLVDVATDARQPFALETTLVRALTGVTNLPCQDRPVEVGRISDGTALHRRAFGGLCRRAGEAAGCLRGPRDPGGGYQATIRAWPTAL